MSFEVRSEYKICIGLYTLVLALSLFLSTGSNLALQIPVLAGISICCLISLGRVRLSLGRDLMIVLGVLGLVLAFLVWRAYGSPNNVAAREQVSLGILASGGMLLGLFGSRSSRSFGSWIVWGTVVVALCQFGIGMVQHFEGGDYFPLPGYVRSGYTADRVGAFFNNPNHYASWGAMVCLLLGSWLCVKVRRWDSGVLFGLVFILSLVGLLLSRSRGGFVAFAVGMFVLVGLSMFVVRRRDPVRFKVILITMTTVGIVSSAVALFVFDSLILNRTGGMTAGSDERQLLREIALKQWRNEPLVGTGPGTFVDFGRLYRPDAWRVFHAGKDHYRAHNDWFQLLSECGAVGFGLFVVFLGGVVGILVIRIVGIGRGTIGTKGDFETEALIVAAMGITVYLSLHSLVDFPMRSPGLCLFFFTVLGCALGARRKKESRGSFVCDVFFAWMRLSIGLGALSFCCMYGPALAREEIAKHSKLSGLERMGLYKELARLDPANDRYVFTLGKLWEEEWQKAKVLLVKDSMLRKSLEHYERAFEMQRNNWAYAQAVAVTLDRLGEYSLAGKYHEESLSLAPNHREGWANYAKHLHLRAIVDNDRVVAGEALVTYAKTIEEFGLGRLRADRQKLVDWLEKPPQ